MKIKELEDDFSVVLEALKNPPSLILDCGNAANPHRFYPYVPYENFKNTYVVAVDAIYRFRDTLKQAGKIADSVGANRIAITSYKYLFSYQDELENKNIFEHCKELIMILSNRYEVIQSQT